MTTIQVKGIILIICGAIYIIRPTIFKIGFWKKTSIAQRAFNPKQYNTYMRILGAITVIIGICLLFIKS